MACEDYPCCGHEAGCCPDFDQSGRQLNMRCTCGAVLPVHNRSSICDSCLRRGLDSEPYDGGERKPLKDCYLDEYGTKEEDLVSMQEWTCSGADNFADYNQMEADDYAYEGAEFMHQWLDGGYEE